MQESQVNRQPLRRRVPIKPEIITDGGRAIAQAGDKPQDLVAAPDCRAAKILPERACQRGQAGFAQRDKPDGGVSLDSAIQFVKPRRVRGEIGYGFQRAARLGELL